MPSIYLGKQKGSYCSGNTKVTVKEEDYTQCKLFKRFKHQFNGGQPLGVSLCVFKGAAPTTNGESGTSCSNGGDTCTNGGTGKLTITLDGQHTNATLQYVDVYYNQYDPDKTPLLFVLHFNGGGSGNKYYKRSDFDGKIRKNETVSIERMEPYYGEQRILQPLITENDSLKDFLTFDITKTKGDDSRDGKYNNNKIEVKDDSSGDRQLTQNGFKRYKHTPVSRGGRKACVIYNCNALLKDKGGTEVEGIQNQEYDSISVYFGNKAKRQSTGSDSSSSSNGGVEDVPLLIELVKKVDGKPTEPEFYVNKKNGSGIGNYYWEKLQDGISSILEDIGLSTSREGRGHETLKKLLQDSKVIQDGEPGSEGDLSQSLKKATGSKLHQLLQQKVNGSKTLLVLLLQRVQFNIVDSVVILMDKNTSMGYGESEIQGAITTLEPPRTVNVLKVNGGNGNITVKDETRTSGTCIQSYNYKVVQHDLGSLVTKLSPPGQSAGIRFFIPTKGSASNSKEGGSKYRELSLYAGGVSTGAQTGPENLVYKYYTHNVGDGAGGGGAGDSTQNDKVYVVFYNGDNDNGDPRPLLLCYNNNSYVPKDKDKYFSDWVKVTSVRNCVCPPPERGDTQTQPVVNALTKVVGFLNEVRLDKGPGTGDGKCGESSPGKPGTTCPGENGKSCTYEVHQYNGKPVKVNVCCEPVSSPPGNGLSCYKKLTHTPHGTGGGGSGFRLGNIIHTDDKSKLDYTKGATISEANKYYPLVKVTAYFYNQDTKYADPLLVELEFSNGVGASSGNNKEYYRLKTSSGGRLEWTKDGAAKTAVGENGKLVAHLDEIRYGIKKVLKIEIQWNKGGSHNSYSLDSRDGNTRPGAPFSHNIAREKQIQVKDCTAQCTQLTNYKCFRHQLTSLGPEDLNQIGGIALTLPGLSGPEKPVEIPLFNGGDGKCQDGNTDHEIKPLTYNKCMGDVYVFFYNKGGTGGVGTGTDTVPLMLWYNKNYYKPQDRDNYFTRWVCVKDLAGQGKKGPPCGKDNGATLAGKLDEVNKELNTIDLYDSSTKRGKTSSYGLPTSTHTLSEEVGNERVKVVTQHGPSKPANVYTRVVHRTKNGFEIGEIHYGSKEITGGITPNGGKKIEVASGNGGGNNHKSKVAGSGWNTVVCYYSTSDKKHLLPQLIVILKTDSEVKGGTDVTGSARSTYGYYILTNKTGGGYEYKWVNVSDVRTQVTLNDSTDFSLLNSIVILIDKNRASNYSETEIKQAISKSGLKSPGRSDSDINRITNKDKNIKVTDATNSDGKCVKDYGYKLFTHYLGSLTTSTQRVSLILGIRLLIHSKDSSDKYNELKLLENGTGDSTNYLYHSSGKSNVYVYFYGETDPRPLLLCYNNNAYRPSSCREYDSKWVHDKTIQKCGCERGRGGGNNNLLDALTQVVGFLNKVELQKHPKTCNGVSGGATTCPGSNGDTPSSCTYEVHQYTGKKIEVRVTCKTVTQDGRSSSPENGNGENGQGNGHSNGEPESNGSSNTCTYKTITHEPVGFNGGAETSGGFRLGDIVYKDEHTGKVNYYTGPSAATHKHNPLVRVTAYYLGDDFEKPLVVVLEFETTQSPPPSTTSKEYFKLTKTGEEMVWEKDVNVESKISSGVCALFSYLQILKFILNKKIYVLLNKHQGKYGESEVKEITDSRKKKIEVSIYQPDQIDVNGEDVTGTESPEQQLESRYKKYTHTITVDLGSTHLRDFPDDAKKDVTLELIPSIPNVTIPMYESAVGTGTKAKLTFKQNGSPQQLSTQLKTELSVYFYNHTGGDSGDSTDKVPLMLQHDNTFYGPSGVGKYFEGWEKLSDITDSDDTSTIVEKFNEINKALNEINISHDTGDGKGAYGISEPSGLEEQLTDFSTDRVKVTCGPVGDGDCPGSPSPPGSNGCTPSPYIKYIHTTINNFQLGQIKYNGSEVKVLGPGQQDNGGSIKIPVQTDENLLEVYYLTGDTKHTYPLLIKIGQQSGGGASQPGDMYYKLKTAKPGTPGNYMWQQDPGAKTQMSSNPSKYLNGINYEVKKVLKIELQHNTASSYDLQLSKGPGQTSDFTPVQATGVGTTGNQIQVTECNKGQCAALNSRGYKCFQHKITSLGPDQLNQVGGIALTLPSKNGPEKPIELKLHNGDGGCTNGNGEPITQVTYNKCMGDVYVFFYGKGGAGAKGDTTDTVPLMLWYNKQYYKPKTRNDYFEKWVCVKDLSTGASDKPCGKDGGTNLVGKLDEVNRSLNTIDLFPDKSSPGGYGLPTKQAGREFSTERVIVTPKAPTSPYANQAYTRVIHRTVNGFEIGDINYSGQEITQHGISAGGGAHFTVNKNGVGNHKSLVDRHKWNTVVAYYSKSDEGMVLPQLIVILKTDKEVRGQTPVTGSGTQYGYYILSTKTDGGVSIGQYEYKWVDVTDVGTQVTLNDATDFTLLNSVVILVDKQEVGRGYNDGQIKSAISKSGLKSPGQSDVNRINTKKTITVTDAATKSDATECSKYGYKVFTHDFGTMVAREEQLAKPALSEVQLILGVRLLIPTGNNGSENGDTKYRQLELCQSGTSAGVSDSTHYLYYKSSQNKVFVYFYSGLGEDEANGKTRDPRPLLLCYDNNAYRPKGKEAYDTKWVNDKSISKCDCKDRGAKNDELLRSLTQVVGFLNTVNLFNRPGKCEGDSDGGPSAPSPTTECDSSSNGSSCTYEVHKYQGKPINVKVTCSKIQGGDSATTAQTGCYYMSMTHTPAGMNGDSRPGVASTNGAPGFRLGQIIHTSESNKLDYVNGPPPSANKWYPLLKVTTYYYSEDKKYEKPLLVVLDFKRSGSKPPGPNGTTVQEYYKLTSKDSMSLSWDLDTQAAGKLGDGRDPNKLFDYLNSIRFENMKVVQIEIHQNTSTSYELKGGTSKQTTKEYRALNGVGDGAGTKKIKVDECTGCTALVSKGYKCFQHKLVDAVEGGLEDKVGGIKLTIPGQGGNDVEIPLFKKKLQPGSEGANGGGGDGSTEYEKITPLTYNKCMGDIYVFFYGSGGKSPGSPDTVPLMLVYNSQFYKPKTRDLYFTKWIPVQGLENVKPGEACGDEPNGKSLVEKLVGALDEVNRELNRIELDNEKVKRGSGSYGLPESGGGGKVDKLTFPTDRVLVTQIPKGPGGDKPYVKVVHRTKNGFTVGKLTSNKGKNDITEQGFQVTGGPVISARNGAQNGVTNNHTQYTNSNKLNTVVVYYAKGDSGYKLPQLMVLMSTDAQVSEGGEGKPVTASKDSKYGYYIIAEENTSNYQYKWRTVTQPEPPAKQLVLDDATDFSLLNSVVILLEKRGTSTGGTSSTSYGDDDIQRAVKAAIKQESITASPGNSNDVNRIQGKQITLNDESKSAPGLSDTGFKLWTHDISALVELSGKLKSALSSVSLIGGLRFLIPTREQDKYKQVTLKENGGEKGESGGKELIMYHQPGRVVDNNKICVFFYQGEAGGGGSNTGSQSNQGDPRPLLMCYANQGYSAKNMEEYDKQEWVKDKEVKDCKCKSGVGDKILKKLVDVSNFLNPVKIHRVTWPKRICRFYYVHWFNGFAIRMKITSEEGVGGFCYDKYTHVHYGACNGGILSSGTGFRLGNIMYKGQCIKETGGDSGDSQPNGTCITAVNENKSPYTPSPEVVTYYYKGDKGHKNPLLVALCKKDGGGQYRPYYELQKSTSTGTGAGDVKKYKKEDKSIELDDTKKLGEKLDKILFNISQRLQVILDQRPMPQLYSPKGKQTKESSKCNFSDKKELQGLEERRKRDYDSLKNPYNCSENNNCNEEIKKLSDYFFYHIPLKTCYQAQLYENDGNPVQNNGQGNTQTHYNIGVEEMKYDALTSKGYRCYKHDLVNTVGIEEVGGLKLYLWANQGEDQFKLHNGTEKNGGGKSDVTYNICKGDIYVYFYGEDPRPLMLCYAGNAYKPKCVKDYEVKWVCVKGVAGKCQCGEEGFEATNVLPVLYGLSMFLNEVDLGETIKAYSSREKPASHKYPVHTYNNTEVRVSVTGTDLSCYKQYVHRPEKGGYRLGKICYNPDQRSSTASSPTGNGECKAQCKQAEGIKYDNHKQLISVSLYYYMYDKDHKWPKNVYSIVVHTLNLLHTASLCTISCFTYIGGPKILTVSSTVRMALLTPSQNPRGLTRYNFFSEVVLFSSN